jgi:hypothetical protein
MVLVSCASPGVSTTPAPTLSPTPTPSPTSLPTPEPTPDLTAYNDCSKAVGPLLKELEKLDARLDIGQTFAEYGDHLQDISIEYNELTSDIDAIPFDCLKVAVKLEEAFNAYKKANDIWDKCFDDLYCTNDSIESKLQAQWLKATHAIESAQKRLRGLKP